MATVAHPPETTDTVMCAGCGHSADALDDIATVDSRDGTGLVHWHVQCDAPDGLTFDSNGFPIWNQEATDMATQTQVRERAVKTSMLGNGREHTHVILSKSRGLDRVIAVSTFDSALDATTRADGVYAEYQRMGFTGRTTWAGTVLEFVKAGESRSFLFTRHCTLRHNIDG